MLASLAARPQAAFAKARTSGATVIVKTATGSVKGELIGVRKDALVVLSKQGSDPVPVSDIESVTIVKHPPVIVPVVLGFAVGCAIGALTAPRVEDAATLTGGDRQYVSRLR